MNLSRLAALIPGARLLGPDVVVQGIHEDSRKITPGDLFVAVRGLRADGHQFCRDVIARGAAACVVEKEIANLPSQLVVPDTATALGIFVSELRGKPSSQMTLIGITGTNGKTTTSYLTESLLAAARKTSGVMGTVNIRYGGKVLDAAYTTPVPEILHDTFAEMKQAGTSHVIMEVSSAALSMKRLAGVQFQVAAFSNLTQDHLDVHQTMAAYREAKSLLFSQYLARDGVAVINIDDPAGEVMALAAGSRKILRVSSNPRNDHADIWVREFESSVRGVTCVVRTPLGEIALAAPSLIGHYNVDNLALSVGIACALGLTSRHIVAGISQMKGVPGRVEPVANGLGLDIFVDYAHTSDALHNVLSALRPLTAGRLLCVFGCGGDRDPGKRPQMGRAVAELADLPFVTSDNPRTEDPQAILNMITPAVPNAFFAHVDRRRAIRAAIHEALPGDVVLIAGKGHEDYQIIGSTKHPFDDREEAAKACAERQRFARNDVQDVTAAELLQPGNRTEFLRLCIDGRLVRPGDLYVAIVGERFDGHDFCEQAIKQGASGLLVSKSIWDKKAFRPGAEISVFAVEETVQALGKIAWFHRKRWRKPVVAITGSAGKTTTKELVAAGLSSTLCVLKSEGSLNNETGVPLTLLKLGAHHDIAVVEMGMRGLGQIAYLCEIAEPTIGVVLNAGTAHVGVVGSVEKIAQAKAEIFAGPGLVTAVFPADDPRLRDYAQKAPQNFSFGQDSSADARLDHYEPRPNGKSHIEVTVKGEHVSCEVPFAGRHNALNATCALAIAHLVEVPVAAAAQAIQSARNAPMRSEFVELRGRHVLLDCYNANPGSMRAAIETLVEQAGPRPKLAVLGDMLELGDESLAEHQAIGELCAAKKIALIAVGSQMAHAAAACLRACGVAFLATDHDQAALILYQQSNPQDWVLLKASRGMKLETVATRFAEVQPKCQ